MSPPLRGCLLPFAATLVLSACVPGGKPGGQPRAEILSPADGAEIAAGDEVTFGGTAVDASGRFGSAELTALWTVADPEAPDAAAEACAASAPGADGTTACTFAPPAARVCLVVTDPDGVADTDCVTLTIVPSDCPDLWYADADGDGYGDDATATAACTAPGGHVSDGTDCDDDDDAVHPGAAEACNDADDDCDGIPDEGVGSIWYADADGDGYGTPALTAEACSPPDGYTSGAGDCDDTDEAVNPAADERCDGADDDCDGTIDRGGSLYVPTDYAAIQDAIDAACDGDAIAVSAGLYLENLSYGSKTLHVTGEGPDRTTVDGGGLGSVVTLSAGSLEGLTITNGRADEGGGVHVGDLGDVTLSDLVIRDNVAALTGGGLYIDGSGGEVVATGVVVEGNTATSYGGGGILISYATADVDLSGVTVSGNTTTYNPGGGIYVYYIDAGRTVDLSGATITGNTTTSQGGGVYAPGTYGLLDLSGATISGNTAVGYGGGVCIDSPSGTVDLSGAAIVGNTGYWGGGAFIDATSGTVDLSGATLSANTADQGGGASVYGDDATVDLSGATLSRNIANYAGGAFVSLSGAGVITVDDAIVADNGGEGLYLAAEASTSVSLTNVTVTGNGSHGVYLYLDPSAPGELVNVISAYNGGYGVYTHGGDPVVSHTDSYGNASGAWYGMSDPTGDAGNLSVDPLFLAFDPDADLDLWDLHLGPDSTLIDAGDPTIVDGDGTASDIGAYSGSGYSADADADGMYDGWELAHGLDPAIDDAADDPDGDGLTSAEEFELGTDPSSADTDGDLDPDGDEVSAGTNPLVPG